MKAALGLAVVSATVVGVKVPPAPPSLGVTVTVPAGERVTLTYEGGDPSKPVACLWTAGAVTRITVNGATARAAREGDDVTKTAGMATWMSSVSSALGILTVPSVVGTISEGSDALRIP